MTTAVHLTSCCWSTGIINCSVFNQINQMDVFFRALLYAIHLFVWFNLIVFLVIIATAIYLWKYSKRIIEEDNADNEDMIKTIEEKKRESLAPIRKKSRDN